MLVSSSDARIVYGVAFPSNDLACPSWCYLYDVAHDHWVFSGNPTSPRGVMDVLW